MKAPDIKAMLRFIGIMLVAEGALMALCLVPAFHFADGTQDPIVLCSAFTLAVGTMLWVSFGKYRRIEDRRMSYLLVVLMWLVLTLFATLPFLVTGATVPIHHSPFTAAWFESMSGLTSCGATVFPEVASLLKQAAEPLAGGSVRVRIEPMEPSEPTQLRSLEELSRFGNVEFK